MDQEHLMRLEGALLLAELSVVLQLATDHSEPLSGLEAASSGRHVKPKHDQQQTSLQQVRLTEILSDESPNVRKLVPQHYP